MKTSYNCGLFVFLYSDLDSSVENVMNLGQFTWMVVSLPIGFKEAFPRKVA